MQLETRIEPPKSWRAIPFKELWVFRDLFWMLIIRATGSLVSHQSLISKNYCPRMLIPMAACGGVLVDFLVTFIVMGVLLWIYQIPLGWQLATLPLWFSITLVLVTGVSFWLSALNVFYRDFSHALPFMIQLWMYASPLAYSQEIIPTSWRGIYALNPLVGILDGFRWSLLHLSDFPLFSITLSFLISLFILLSGALAFQRLEQKFADII